jgi:hypothetical protein
MSSPRLKFVLGGFVIVAALVWLGFIGYEESKAYYITVEEFSAMQGQLQGKTVKVAGDVVEGSIDRASTPMELAWPRTGFFRPGASRRSAHPSMRRSTRKRANSATCRHRALPAGNPGGLEIDIR